MSNLRLCPSCDKLSFDKPVLNSKKANWLKEFNFVQDFIKNTPLEAHEEKAYNIKKEVDIGIKNKNKFVLYWGSESNKFDNFKIKDAKTAYGEFKNYGVAEINDEGKIIILLRTPQIYTDENDKEEKEIFFRHFHYVLSNSKNTEWDADNVYTQLLLGYYSFYNLNNAIKSKKVVVLNTLSPEYYGLEHIPFTWNLPTDKVLKMTEKEVDIFIKTIIELNYPLIKKEIDEENNFNIKCVPIIVYCENEQCNLSHLCAKKLTEMGFNNISTFPAGMEKYRDSNSKNSNFKLLNNFNSKFKKSIGRKRNTPRKFSSKKKDYE